MIIMRLAPGVIITYFMKKTKKNKRIYLVAAILAVALAAIYFVWPEKDPEEAVKCSRNEDCELYQCANCANKGDIPSAERGNEGCNPDLRVGCSCVDGSCRREYR